MTELRFGRIVSFDDGMHVAPMGCAWQCAVDFSSTDTLATARFGMELGFHVTLIKDATAAFNPEGMEAARVNSVLYAHASITTNELLAALPALAPKEQAAGAST